MYDERKKPNMPHPLRETEVPREPSKEIPADVPEIQERELPDEMHKEIIDYKRF